VADLTERVAMLADDAQPHDENRKLAKHLYAEKEACSPSSHTTRRCHELAGGAGDPPGGREPQGLGREQDLAGSRHQARMMSLIRTAASRTST